MKLVPAILAFGGFWLSRNENRYSLKLQERREEEARKLEDQRAKEGILQSYLDQMTKLLLDHKLAKTTEDAIERRIARAWTLSALESLDKNRRLIIFRFLYEAGLLTYSETDNSVLEMKGAHLDEILFFMSNFRNINLSGAHITEADLAEIDMSKSMLSVMLFNYTRLEHCNFEDSDFTDSDLGSTVIQECNFRYTKLIRSYLTDSYIHHSNFEGATLTELTAPRMTVLETNMNGVSLYKASLEESKFVSTSLENANFSEAKAIKVDFTGSNLKGAVFRNSDLRGAVFYNAVLDQVDFRYCNISENQLVHAKSYNGVLLSSDEEILSKLLSA